ncbi:hypothetical protein GCM10010156_65920 [Planobispora rosea]|uniref:Uncharacterized protein n=1 Tax=Planobispora rosea TaxID=35762 RepID=A0A8J3S3X1_PLARO|nr:hypothetical protein [Planobispora rosea]GGS98615.1 hypothetical protein GCM10010156_65920 [Planobispora rosea]GIH87956.1 hypothetical protein Pro02_63640 [Planobispora rosea]
MDAPDHRPSAAYTLAELAFLTLGASAGRTAQLMEALDIAIDPREFAETELARTSRDPATLRTLAASTYASVRRAVAGNPATPAAAIRALTREADDVTVERATCHPALQVADLEFLSLTGSGFVRAGVLRHPRVPQHLVDRATGDADPYARAVAAGHLRVREEALARLAVDDDAMVRAAAAGHPRLPVLAFPVLAADMDRWVRIALAANPHLPEAQLVLLAADAQVEVRAAAAAGPALTPDVAALLADDVEQVQRALAASLFCPVGVLRHLARPRCRTAVRQAVADHPACPADLRHHLAARDRSIYVRQRAAAWLKGPVSG